MDIIRATTAGFCMGVSLALQKLEEELTQSRNLANSRICTLGPIIHNPQVLADFESKGVVCINNENEIGPDDRVLIRAHGVPQNRGFSENKRRSCSGRDLSEGKKSSIIHCLRHEQGSNPFAFWGIRTPGSAGAGFLRSWNVPYFQ